VQSQFLGAIKILKLRRQKSVFGAIKAKLIAANEVATFFRHISSTFF
jgi:hypothetical protein